MKHPGWMRVYTCLIEVSGGNDLQVDPGGVFAVVQDALLGNPDGGPDVFWFTGVEIAVPTREVTRGDMDPQLVSSLDQDRSGPKVDGDLIDAAGLGVNPGDAVDDVAGDAFSIHFAEPHDPVGGRAVGHSEQGRADAAGDLGVWLQRCGGEHEYVVTSLGDPLV